MSALAVEQDLRDASPTALLAAARSYGRLRRCEPAQAPVLRLAAEWPAVGECPENRPHRMAPDGRSATRQGDRSSARVRRSERRF